MGRSYSNAVVHSSFRASQHNSSLIQSYIVDCNHKNEESSYSIDEEFKVNLNESGMSAVN
jgi:hypothetical protein